MGTSRAAEEVVAHDAGSTTRFNLLVPAALKQAIDREAEVQGMSGPELARRLLDDGLRALHERAIWQRVREVAPLHAERERRLMDWWDRWDQAWEAAAAAAGKKSDATKTRRHR